MQRPKLLSVMMLAALAALSIDACKGKSADNDAAATPAETVAAATPAAPMATPKAGPVK